jgi:dUTP pyrophosphatase
MSVSEIKKIKFVRLSKYAKSPIRGSSEAAGWDLFAAYETTVPKNDNALILTDISIQIPFGYYGRVAARSGIALINNISINAGVIDSDYRGNIGVCMTNHSNQDFQINVGQRCAQLIIEKYLANCIFDEVEELDNTKRNKKGFGSTGNHEINTFLDNFAMDLTIKKQ